MSAHSGHSSVSEHWQFDWWVSRAEQRRTGHRASCPAILCSPFTCLICPLLVDLLQHLHWLPPLTVSYCWSTAASSHFPLGAQINSHWLSNRLPACPLYQGLRGHQSASSQVCAANQITQTDTSTRVHFQLAMGGTVDGGGGGGTRSLSLDLIWFDFHFCSFFFIATDSADWLSQYYLGNDATANPATSLIFSASSILNSLPLLSLSSIPSGSVRETWRI